MLFTVLGMLMLFDRGLIAMGNVSARACMALAAQPSSRHHAAHAVAARRAPPAASLCPEHACSGEANWPQPLPAHPPAPLFKRRWWWCCTCTTHAAPRMWRRLSSHCTLPMVACCCCTSCACCTPRAPANSRAAPHCRASRAHCTALAAALPCRHVHHHWLPVNGGLLHKKEE